MIKYCHIICSRMVLFSPLYSVSSVIQFSCSFVSLPYSLGNIINIWA